MTDKDAQNKTMDSEEANPEILFSEALKLVIQARQLKDLADAEEYSIHIGDTEGDYSSIELFFTNQSDKVRDFKAIDDRLDGDRLDEAYEALSEPFREELEEQLGII